MPLRAVKYALSHRNSVRPSVRLSHSWTVSSVHMVRPTIMISSPCSSPMILVSGDIRFIPKFEEGHPERGRWIRVGKYTNWRFSTFKPPYLRNGARYDKGYYWSLMGIEYALSIGTKIDDLGWLWNDLGRPWARALNEGGVGTNWRFSTNRPPYLGNGASNWCVGVSGFRTKLFENLQRYPYTVSDKNVAQGT